MTTEIHSSAARPDAGLLSPGELAALLHFYGDCGVEWLVEDEAVDRVAGFAARQEPAAPPPAPVQKPETRRVPATPVAVPDGEAVAAARAAAAGADTLAALKAALADFSGCNLKHGARSTVFASGDPRSGTMVIGPMPNADDDREGEPFSGRAGQLLDRMLGAIGLARPELLLTTIIPWRPPGNRMPSAIEIEICRPFLERQIALASPRRLLLLGNFSARFFLDANGSIHSLRGRWRSIDVADVRAQALATLHPQDLLAAPANKALAWADLLAFHAGPPEA